MSSYYSAKSIRFESFRKFDIYWIEIANFTNLSENVLHSSDFQLFYEDLQLQLCILKRITKKRRKKLSLYLKAFPSSHFPSTMRYQFQLHPKVLGDQYSIILIPPNEMLLTDYVDTRYGFGTSFYNSSDRELAMNGFLTDNILRLELRLEKVDDERNQKKMILWNEWSQTIAYIYWIPSEVLSEIIILYWRMTMEDLDHIEQIQRFNCIENAFTLLEIFIHQFKF